MRPEVAARRLPRRDRGLRRGDPQGLPAAAHRLRPRRRQHAARRRADLLPERARGARQAPQVASPDVTFLNPALALGALLFAVPLVIHLLNRQRHKRRPWAAMEFLLKAYQKQRNRLRNENLL
ncbi:MAG: hypothetical protein FJ306_03440, partial [Planctomycetes bacterium]|nr:hypothetical protein [Planctomycetota bacterium]